eukprot:12562-Prymnesium_polylepis.2
MASLDGIIMRSHRAYKRGFLLTTVRIYTCADSTSARCAKHRRYAELPDTRPAGRGRRKKEGRKEGRRRGRAGLADGNSDGNGTDLEP